MLEELKLSNFRIFDDEVTVDFRPITILIGRNNAGKSSIINFLLMLQQSLEPGARFLVPHGPKVRLGRLSEAKNKKTRKGDLAFSLTMAEHDSPPRYVLNNHKGKTISYTLQANVLYSNDEQFLGDYQKLVYSIDGEKSIERTARISENSSLLSFTPEHSREQWAILSDMDDPNIAASSAYADIQEKIRIENYCAERLSYNIREWRHLSAIRQPLPRVVDTGYQAPPKYVGSEGEYAISQFQHEIYELEERKTQLLRHTEKMLGINHIQLKNIEGFTMCNARNAHTGATVNIADFGLGVSQCFPILVQGLLMAPHTHVIVEQPEAQLHPTAQLDLGSFFADLWKKNKVGSIIETHGENLISRLRRLIAQKSDSSNNGSNLCPDDVSIALFDTEGKKTTVKMLYINEDGEYVDKEGNVENGLPMEFFGASIVEGLERRAKR